MSCRTMRRIIEKYEAKGCIATPFHIRAVEPPSVKKVAMSFNALFVTSDKSDDCIWKDAMLLADRILDFIQS